MISKSRPNDMSYEDTLAKAIVNTMRVPMLVLSRDLRVIVASRSFCQTFGVSSDETTGGKLSELGDGQWDIPVLLRLLEEIIPRHTTMEGFEVEHDFPTIGHP